MAVPFWFFSLAISGAADTPYGRFLALLDEGLTLEYFLQPVAWVLFAPFWLLIGKYFLELRWMLQERTRKRPFRMAAIALVAIFVLVLIQSGAQEARQTVAAPKGERFLARIAVSLEFDGAPVRIDRVVECRYYVITRAALSSRNRRPHVEYAAAVGVIGTRLEGGGAIFMWTPYRCAHQEVTNKAGEVIERRALDNLPEYFPIIGWIPDPDTVDRFELYVSPAYYADPRARIGNVQIKVSPCPISDPACVADPADEFNWLTMARFVEDKFEGPSVSYKDYPFVSLSSVVWAGVNSELDNYLRDFSEPAFIDRHELPSGKRASAAASLVARKVLGGNSPPKQSRLRNSQIDRLTPMGSLVNSFESVRALRVDKEGLRIDPKVIPGRRVLYKFRSGPKFPVRPGDSPASIPYLIRQTTIFPSLPLETASGEIQLIHPSNYIFDPTSQTIIWVPPSGYGHSVRVP